MPSPQGSRIYEFGDFRLDAAQRLLLSKADARPLPLVSRAFEALLYLVEHSGELVTKTALMEAVWPQTVVEENNLSQSIAAIRRVLGERPGEHKYIVTIAGRGFRFVAPVNAVNAAPATGAQNQSRQLREGRLRHGVPAWFADRRLFLVALAVVAVALMATAYFVRSQRVQEPEPHTLAILPFKPVAPSDGDKSLQYGMADTLISRLKDLEGVSVQPFSSVRRYGNSEQDAVSAARELGVAAVLDGTIQRSGDRLRVTARLLNAANGRQLWSAQFHEDFTDIFAVQDAIAAKVTDALQIRLTGQSHRRLTHRYTDNAEAYQLYVNGWFQRSRTDEIGYRRSIDFFEQAIALDPGYPLPYVGLADCYVMLSVFGALAPDVAFPRALAAISKALEIDSELGEAHASLAHIKVQYERDLQGAGREYLRALSIAPDYAVAHMWYGLYLAQTGKLDEAVPRLRHAQRLEPLQLGTSANIGMLLYFSRRYDDAVEQLRQVLEVEPGMDHARSLLGRAYLRKGDHGMAIQEFKRRKSLSVGSYSDLAIAYALAGRRQEALAELDRLLTLAPQRYVSAYDIASIQASLGNADQAFEWLGRAIPERAPMLGFLYLDPSFDTLRDDPRMMTLLAQIGAPLPGGAQSTEPLWQSPLPVRASQRQQWKRSRIEAGRLGQVLQSSLGSVLCNPELLQMSAIEKRSGFQPKMRCCKT